MSISCKWSNAIINKIRNYKALTERGSKEAREKVLSLMEEVLKEVDAGKRIHELMCLNGDILTVGERKWDLRKKKNIYLIGAGKACNAMAQAVCEILGERITRGIISVKIAEPQDHYVNTDVYIGGHPLPNAEGMAAAQKMLELIDSAGEDDLFISVISGGSSALITCPIEGITLEDEILAQKLLLESGAKISEINAVRRHISRTNGGRLAERILGRGSELISLIVSDGVGPSTQLQSERKKPAKFFGTPMAPDGTMIEDARKMIENYDLSEKLPRSITAFMMDDERVRETPKSFDDKGDKFVIYILGAVADSCEEAVRIAGKMGIPILVLSTFMEGESRESGYFISSVVREAYYRGRPVCPPCYIVFSGETTTAIQSQPKGMGGPSQELVLGFCIGIRGLEGVAGASIDTEGTDGTTPYAGGLVDGGTFQALEQCGVSVYEALRGHSAGNALEKIGDNIMTGNTGTNLCDFNVFYISKCH